MVMRPGQVVGQHLDVDRLLVPTDHRRPAVPRDPHATVGQDGEATAAGHGIVAGQQVAGWPAPVAGVSVNGSTSPHSTASR